MAPPFAVVPATTADDSWSAGVELATRVTLNSRWRRASPFNVVPVICDVKRGASGIAGIGWWAIPDVADAGLWSWLVTGNMTVPGGTRPVVSLHNFTSGRNARKQAPPDLVWAH